MKEITAAEFDGEVLNGEKMILDFYSTECPPCEALAVKFEDLSRLYGNEPRAFVKEGDKIVTEVENVKTKERRKLVSDGVFIFIGMKPNIALFKDKLALDQWGYIKTDEDMRTSIPGVYAVGDVISKKYRQITTAVADGTIAAMAIAKELD